MGSPVFLYSCILALATHLSQGWYRTRGISNICKRDAHCSPADIEMRRDEYFRSSMLLFLEALSGDPICTENMKLNISSFSYATAIAESQAGVA